MRKFKYKFFLQTIWRYSSLGIKSLRLEGTNVFDILQDILIITDSGKVIASKVNNPQIEEQTFGMLMSALSSFVGELTHDQLNCLEFNNIRFDIVKRNNFLFLASSSRRIKHKKVLRIIDHIIDLFFERYPKEELNKWDGNVNIFHELEEYITKTRDELIIELIFKEKGSHPQMNR